MISKVWISFQIRQKEMKTAAEIHLMPAKQTNLVLFYFINLVFVQWLPSFFFHLRIKELKTIPSFQRSSLLSSFMRAN